MPGARHGRRTRSSPAAEDAPRPCAGPGVGRFWLTGWLHRLGGTHVVPDEPVTVVRERSGAVSELRVDAVVHLPDGSRLDVSVRLDRHLNPLWYTFDLIGPAGRLWGRHGHPERTGFNHRHEPPDFRPQPAEVPVTLLGIETLLHER